MSNQSSEQFDVLSNALRILPEEIFRLNYFIQNANDPEEGISNIEMACVNVFNQLYGMMCSLKESGHVSSIYEHDAITTILCMRHALQHKAGRIQNNLRDAFKKQIGEKTALINYNVSDTSTPVIPFYIRSSWLHDSVQNSHNSHRLASINTYLNFDQIKDDLDKKSIAWTDSYLCVMPLITEAVRQIRTNYGCHFEPTGDDSSVYYSHLLYVNPINTSDYAIAT